MYEYNDNINNENLKERVGIDRIQIEQDSGKSLHDSHPYYSLVDLNRAGVGLIEIVFAPELHSPEQAVGLLKTTQEILRHLSLCSGTFESGSMRCDVNISVQHIDSKKLGNRVEIKNLNSFERVLLASRYEIKRQIEVLENGLDIDEETRGYDVDTIKTFRMRTKENKVDYRFLPDPDLPPLMVSDEDILRLKETVAELPNETSERLTYHYGLDSKQTYILISKQGVKYFEDIVKGHYYFNIKKSLDCDLKEKSNALIVYNWLTSELLGHLNTTNSSFTDSPITPKQFGDILQYFCESKLSAPQTKQLIANMFHDADRNIDVKNVVEKLGLHRIDNDNVIHSICIESINDPKNQKQLKQYKDGNKNMIKYFFGDIMRRSKGQADPKVVEKLLRELLQ